jgi:hypothetical protein
MLFNIEDLKQLSLGIGVHHFGNLNNKSDIINSIIQYMIDHNIDLSII